MWSSDTFSDRVIEMDKFAYSKGICCNYHEVTNVPHYCSRSVVVRYAYTICDNCCGDLDIPLVPGHHVPLTSKVPRIRASSQMSLASSNMRPTTRDDDTDSVNSMSTHSEWEKESVTSYTSATDSADDFPALPAAGKNPASTISYTNFGDTDRASVTSSSSKSYAGSCTSGRGRGRAKRQADLPSTSSLANEMNRLDFGAGGPSFSMNRNEFPSLGGSVPGSMARGRRPKGQSSNSQTSQE
ncbi:unnamed protein product [Acanthoscelides obtectus]|nr:unnamed protein product [Acanthoscelides obtectus]CAK1661786.1 Protein maelstrom homolog [Acanthoscelides obtectus]